MIVFVNNCKVIMEQLTFRELGYGRRVDHVDHVNIRISKSTFISMMEHHYDEFIEETANEVYNFGWDPPWVQAVYEIPLTEFIEEHHGLLNELIVEYHFHKLLEEIFYPSSNKGKVNHVINKINEVIVEDSDVILKCDAYPIRG